MSALGSACRLPLALRLLLPPPLLLLASIVSLSEAVRLDVTNLDDGTDDPALKGGDPVRIEYDPAAEAKKPLKNVLVVIDVQAGYDSAFVGTLSGKAGLAYLEAEHPVDAAYKLGPWKSYHEKVVAKRFGANEKKITYDKGWNRGLSAEMMTAVTSRVNTELAKGAAAWDLVVFTYDYLDPSAQGVFPLDSQSWSDPDKEVALVPYGEFLSITAHNAGAEVDSPVSPHPHCRKHSGVHMAGGLKVLCFRKQVDDAFDETLDGAGNAKKVDVDDEGQVKAGGKTLFRQLTDLNLEPSMARLTFVGVVTSRCVKSSLLHACQLGYKVTLLQGGARDDDTAKHAAAVQDVLAKCPSAQVLD